VPDLPGCVATGPTVAAVQQEIRDAIRFHVNGLSADGLPVPVPTSIAEYVAREHAEGLPPTSLAGTWLERAGLDSRFLYSLARGSH